MLQIRIVMLRARRDEQIGCGNGYTARTGLACEIAGASPDILINLKLRQEPFEIPQRLFFTLTSCAVPQLQADNGAPARLTCLKGSLDASAYRGIPIRPQKVDPG